MTFDFALSWMLTYSVHSAVLAAAGMLLVRRWLGPGARGSAVLKMALFGALFSASLPWRAVNPLPLLGAPEASVAASTAAPGVFTAALPAVVGEGVSASAQDSARPLPAPITPSGPFPWGAVLLGLTAAVALLSVAGMAVQRQRFIASLRRTELGDLEAAGLVRTWAQESDLAPIALMRSQHLAAPVVLSRGEICVPEDCWEGLDGADRAALLAHEFAHIERRDPAWFLAAAAIERAFFFLPWHRALRRRVNEAAEVACDALAAERVGSRTAVARCLANVAAWARGEGSGAIVPHSVPAMAAAPNELVSRVQFLLAGAERPAGGRFALLAGASLVAFACCAPALTTQDAAVDVAGSEGISIDVAADGRAQASLTGSFPDPGGVELDLDDWDERPKLQSWLAEAVSGSPTAQVGNPSFPVDIHEGPILIRADVRTPMKYVQWLMAMCGSQEVSSPNLVLRVAGTDHATPLPHDLGVMEGELQQRLDVRIDALPNGAGAAYQVGPAFVGPAFSIPEETLEGGEDEPIIEEPEPERAATLLELRAVIQGQVESGTPFHATLDPRKGVSVGSTTEVLALLRYLGATSVTFKGSYER